MKIDHLDIKTNDVIREMLNGQFAQCSSVHLHTDV